MKDNKVPLKEQAHGIRGAFRYEDEDFPERFNGIYMPVFMGMHKPDGIARECVNIMTGTTIRLHKRTLVEDVDLDYLQEDLL